MIPRPIKGSFPWPGRENLSVRDRLLLEGSSVKELFNAYGMLECDLNSNVGYWEYLLMDWMRLRDPRCQDTRYISYHAVSLRDATSSYSKEIKWQGRIPRTNAVSDMIAVLLN